LERIEKLVETRPEPELDTRTMAPGKTRR